MEIVPSIPSHFYINTNAIKFEFNALGDPDNLSVSIYHNAKVTAFVRNIPGLGFTPADEYHTWILSAFPTHFTDDAGVARYCHAAVQRNGSNATLVYPPHRLDVLGRHISDDGNNFLDDNGNVITVDVSGQEPPEDENYFFFFIGKISASDYGSKNRNWTGDGSYPVFGILDTARYHEDDFMKEIDKLRAYIDSNLFFERYPVGDPFEVMEKDPVTGNLVPKQEQVKDADGNLLFYADEEHSTQTTETTEWPVLTPVINENTAIRLKTKFLGLFTEGWLSAYGINSDGTGTPGGSSGSGTIGERLDEWSKYDKAKPQVLGANLGVDLNERVIKLENKKYITSWNDLTDKPSLGKFAYKDLLTEDDIPQLSINKIINLQQSLDKKLDKSIFDELFEKVTLADGKTTAIKAKYGLFSVGFVSAYGQNDDESSSSGSIIKDRLDDWKIYTDDKAQWVLSAKLGVELYTALNTTVAASLADLDERIKALAADPGEILSFPSKGSGNAVTSVIKSGTTVTVTKGATFLTEHQSLAAYMKTSDFTKQAITDKLGTSTFVSSFGTKTGAITVRGGQTANGSVNLVMNNNELQASIVGLQALAFKASLAKADVGLGNVENTALSTWKGTTNITTLGTITSGTWHGSKIANAYLENNSMTLWGNTVSLGGITNGSITIKNGSKSVTLSVDSNGYLQVNSGFYSTSFISAYGLSSASAITSSGGHITSGHLYLDGAVSNSSTSNVTQIIFRANGDQQVALSSNKNELIINPNSSGTNGQIELGVNGGNTRFRSDTAKFAVRGYLRVGTEDVGTGWDSWRMYVNGTACIESTLNCRDSIQLKGQTIHSSDVRLKNIGDDVLLSIKEIADAPCFKFSFKDEEDSKTFRIGSSAQYWQNILPDTVSVDDQGWLGLDYTAVSYAAVVALAKQSESHEERIKRLEEENKELRNNIVELERA